MIDQSLASWLRRLEALHPSEIDLGLARVRAVADRLQLTDTVIRTVIVAGTNGKGSVVATLEAALLATGASCGAYTSPHLLSFNERIRVAGKAVDDAAIVEAFAAIEQARGDISLTYFEFATLAGLWVFRERRLDWQVLEVGLGGRLDAVNIIDADIAVITSIGLDHLEWLGPDRDHIAVEKARVARAGKPCVVLEQDPPDTLLPELAEIGADVVLLGRDFDLAKSRMTTCAGRTLPLPDIPGLLETNVAGALQALELTGTAPDRDDVLDAIRQLQVPGRRQRLMWRGRELVLDVAHNLESVACLIDWHDDHPSTGATYAVYASLSDKPFRAILAAINGRVAHWYLPRFDDVARALEPAELAACLTGAPVDVCAEFGEAWRAVFDASEPGDRILVFGSFITVGAALMQMQTSPKQVD